MRNKKYLFLLALILCIISFLGYLLASNKIAVYDTDSNYLGSEFKGNYVWGGAMNLAWNELSENIIHEKIKINTTSKTAMEMTEKFNDAIFTKNDLDENSYYIKSGYGQKTVTAINKESKEKFPSKSFGDLDITLRDKDIISYAYFLKEVEYLNQFNKKDIVFNKESVKGFYADGSQQKENIKILKYWDDDKFIISLQLKNIEDELILAKGFNMKKPDDIVDQINQYNVKTENISSSDVFKMPNLHLDYNRTYSEIVGKFLLNKDFEDYAISRMFENIKFDMDNKGVRVENEAAITMSPTSVGGPSKKPKIKQFILDKPFWVVMERKNSQNPYFILGVNNTEIMEK